MVTSAAYPAQPVYIVDDELQVIHSVDIALKASGIRNTLHCLDSRKLFDLMCKKQPGAMLLDLNMPFVSGREVLRKVTREYPDVPVIVVTGNDDLDTAVSCMKSGAFDYMTKPISRDRLISSVKRAIEMSELRQENRELKQHALSGELKNPDAFTAFDSISPRMQALFGYVEAIATSPAPIMITGETGTGKELFARCIHKVCCPDAPFVPVNVAGLDENSFSDTLFGHRKGAFTGADGARDGLIEKAGGGILFLDEIGDIKPEMQVKLLRLLQEKEYLPLGSDVSRRANARIIVATNRDLEKLTREGVFRVDLFYRLRHHHLHIPPLRERREDLPRLARRLLEDICREQGRPVLRPGRRLLEFMAHYSFTGNVRELQALLHDAVSRSKDDQLNFEGIDELAVDVTLPAVCGVPAAEDISGMFTDGELPTLKEVQNLLVAAALERCDGNQSQAAAMLGISRQALNRRVHNLGR